MTRRCRTGLFSALISVPIVAISVSGVAGAPGKCENWFLDRGGFF